MKRIIYVLSVASFFTACSKTAREKEPEITICPEPANLQWLNVKKAAYSNCYCLTGIRQGIYQNQPVIEIYGFDPLCNGINSVYKIDGTVWFNSADKATYENYSNAVEEQHVIWTCSKGNE